MLEKLPVVSTILGAYAAVFGNLGKMLRAAIAPTVAIVVLAVIEGSLPQRWFVQLPFWLMELAFAAMIAVACHRIILLGPDAKNSSRLFNWHQRVSSFYVWLIILGVFTYVVTYLIGFLAIITADKTPAIIITLVGVAYLEGRFSMVLPATAIDQRMVLSSSWYLTDGNGLRLAVILLTPILIAIGLFWLIAVLLSGPPATLVMILYFAVACITILVQIGVLSLSYRFLSDSAADGTK